LVQCQAAGSCSFVIGASGRTWGWGSNRCLELGLRKEVAQVDTPKLIKHIRDHPVVQISASRSITGQAHTFALMANGEVFSFGTSMSGALGLGAPKCSGPTILAMTSTVQIRQVHCGARHTLLVADDGHVYTMGANTKGQLGTGASSSQCAEPTLVTGLQAHNVRTAAVGDDHNLVVTTQERMFAWGSNHCGQLGIGKVADSHVPVQIQQLQFEVDDSGICSFAAGGQHSMVVTRRGKSVFSFGSGASGQLGLGMVSFEDSAFRLYPTLIPDLSGKEHRTIVQVAAAAEHSFALDKNGELLAFGENDHGQLGFLPHHSPLVQRGPVRQPWVKDLRSEPSPMDGEKCVWRPTLVTALRNFRVGMVSTADRHTIVLAH